MTDLIQSAFGPRSTAAEVAAGHDLSGQRMVVTGGASGIGIETAAALAGAGAEVILAARNLDAARTVAATINAAGGPGHASVEALDLADPRSVALCAARLLEEGAGIDVLINNAGVMATPEGRTAAGFETQFGTNHFGHFLLTAMLLPALETAAADRGRPARVVSLSSIGHRLSDIIWDDIHYGARPYDKWTAYGQSKTANALFAVGLSARCAGRGVLANAVMPGGIMTGLQKHLPTAEMVGFGWIDENGVPNPRMKTPAQGGATSVWAAIGAELEGAGGLYLEDCRQAAPFDPARPFAGVQAYALDPSAADRLWTLSEAAVGFSA